MAGPERVSGPLGLLDHDARRLVDEFGARAIDELPQAPERRFLQRALVASHRDLDRFIDALTHGKRCAVVAGFNASGSLHFGHRPILELVRHFQSAHGVDVIFPISDDESYLAGKVATQEVGLGHALGLARQIIAYGFDPVRTRILIDQLDTSIYNLAIRLSKHLTLSEVRATYGFGMDTNPGLAFYPAVQAAHVLMPLLENSPYEDVLVPIGPDEDAHLRLARDIASRIGVTKPAVAHLRFLPGTDGAKMSKSKGNVLGFLDAPEVLRRRIAAAWSGGRPTVSEHRQYGGDPENDVAYAYLRAFFLSDAESRETAERYRAGELLSGELKDALSKRLLPEVNAFQERLARVGNEELAAFLTVPPRAAA